MNLLVKMADSAELEYLRGTFMKIDKENTGFIDLAELRDALHGANIKLDDTELEKIINEVDYHG